VRRQERRIGSFIMGVAVFGFGSAVTATILHASAPSILFMVLCFNCFIPGLSIFKGWW
jgi:hypothetical protein